MVTFSFEQLPMMVALVAFLLALIAKRNTIRISDIVAFVLMATLAFALLTGAFNLLHVPHFAFHVL